MSDTETPICPYCGARAMLVYTSGRYAYTCTPCNASVQCWDNSMHPRGTLANAELRAARVEARVAFNTIWQSGEKSRKGAYLWLAAKLDVKPRACEFERFDLEMCERVIDMVCVRAARKAEGVRR